MNINMNKDKLEALIRKTVEAICDLEQEERFESGDTYNEDYAIINGIRLKRQNETVRFCKHFSFNESLKIAKEKGLRLPSKEEWETISELGSTWDNEKEGIWIGKNHKLKKETDYSTFLPTMGCGSHRNSLELSILLIFFTTGATNVAAGIFQCEN